MDISAVAVAIFIAGHVESRLQSSSRPARQLTNFVVAGGGPAGRWPVAGRCGTHKCNFDRCAQSFE